MTRQKDLRLENAGPGKRWIWEHCSYESDRSETSIATVTHSILLVEFGFRHSVRIVPHFHRLAFRRSAFHHVLTYPIDGPVSQTPVLHWSNSRVCHGPYVRCTPLKIDMSNCCYGTCSKHRGVGKLNFIKMVTGLIYSYTRNIAKRHGLRYRQDSRRCCGLVGYGTVKS